MKTRTKRLEKLEKETQPPEAVFIEWKGGAPWTEEEKAEIRRLNPDGGVFIRSLVASFPIPDQKKD